MIMAMPLVIAMMVMESMMMQICFYLPGELQSLPLQQLIASLAHRNNTLTPASSPFPNYTHECTCVLPDLILIHLVTTWDIKRVKSCKPLSINGRTKLKFLYRNKKTFLTISFDYFYHENMCKGWSKCYS